MSSDTLGAELRKLSRHYDTLAKRHGYSPHAVQQSSVETQERRLDVLLSGFFDVRSAKVLDFGCGTGHFYRYLAQREFSGEYVGYDISPELISLATTHHPDARFELRNILDDIPEEMFDFIFISGVFNNDIGCNEEFLRSTLRVLYGLSRVGLAFNCLSTYVDFKAPGLYYFDPSQVFDFCKTQLSTNVALRHDYETKPGVVPFEFTCHVHRSSHEPRSRIDA